MIVHLLLLFFCIFMIEIFRGLKFYTKMRSLNLIYKKIINLISSKKISDHWKEVALVKYSNQAILLSLESFFIILIPISILMIIYILNKDAVLYFFSVTGLIESLVFIFLYFTLRKKVSNE